MRRKAKIDALGKGAIGLGSIAALASGNPILAGLGSAAAFTIVPMILDRLMHGSEEDQMRHQMELQQKVAGVEPAPAGGAPGAAYVQYEQPSMVDLAAGRDLTDSMLKLGTANRNFQRNLARPSGTSELESLLAGDEARMRQLQSERILTPYEIMSAIDG